MRNNKKFLIVIILFSITIFIPLFSIRGNCLTEITRVALPYGRQEFNGYSNHIEGENFEDHYNKHEIYINYDNKIIQFNISIWDDDDGGIPFGERLEFVHLGVSDGRNDPSGHYYLTNPMFRRDGNVTLEEEFQHWAQHRGTSSEGFNFTYYINDSYYGLSNGSVITFYVSYNDYYGSGILNCVIFSYVTLYLIDESNFGTTTNTTRPIPGFVFPIVIIIIFGLCLRLISLKKKEVIK
jgi:hypothetical protein